MHYRTCAIINRTSRTLSNQLIKKRIVSNYALDYKKNVQMWRAQRQIEREQSERNKIMQDILNGFWRLKKYEILN